MSKFRKTNQGTCINLKAIVKKGDRVSKGQVLCQGYATETGELALGRNLKVAFMPWKGYNFEDAIVISEKVVREDFFTSIHIEEFEVLARDTKLGQEDITRDIPNVGDEALTNLDEAGIVHIGAEVNPGDILVGKVTPKGESPITPEEKLLRAIFGEKSRDIRNTSLKLPHGTSGRVLDVKLFSRSNMDDLPPGTNEIIKVYIAQKRKIQIGDKMAGRHGNKGCISKIVPVEDMPHLEDGTPIDILLNPLGVPSRMNVGQILETHLGWACAGLGKKISKLIDAYLQDNKRKELEENLNFLYDKEIVGQIISNKKELLDYKSEINKGVFISTPVFDGAKEKDIIENKLEDLTLPRTKDYICPNNKCDSHKNFVEKEAIFYRPFKNSYNLKYVCGQCMTSWLTGNNIKSF